MKKLFKLTALFIAFVLAFSVLPVSLAAETESCPVIYVPGINSSQLYRDVNDADSKMFFPGMDEIKDMAIKEVVPALIIYAKDKDTDKLAGVLSEQFNILFKDYFLNADGSVKGNSGAILHYPSSVKSNSTIVFDWDWRCDPFDAAAKLDDFIDYAIDKSGCEKVALAAHSLGSVVILTYLSVYGDSKISGIVYDSPAIDGANYLGEFLLGNFETDGEALISAVNGLFYASENEGLVESVMDVFDLAGIPTELSLLLNSVLDEVAPVIFKDTLVPLFARWPSVWSLVPDADFDAAVDYIFTECLTDSDSMKLKEKVVKYDTEVRNNRYATICNFDINGRLAVISRYGYSSLPLMNRWEETGDTIIETKSTSLGATVAAYGEVLADDYLKDKDEKYISPDKTVDASTCLVPEKTWFIKGIKHADTVTKALYPSLLFGEQEATCDNYSLTRFSVYDAEAGSFVEDMSEPEVSKEKTPLQVLFNFLKELFRKLFSFFKIG